MKKYLIIIILIFIVLKYDLKSQTATSLPQYISDIFAERVEVYFKFNISTKNELDYFSQIISVSHISGNEVYAYANKNEFQKFLNFQKPYTVLPAPSTLINPTMKENVHVKSIQAWDFYPAYGTYESMMYQFQNDYPSLCKVYNLGTLSSGRKILVAKISDNVNSKEYEPRFSYSSSMHGDELTGFVLMLRLIDYLLSNHGTDPKITNLVNNIEIWITPLENPDGTYTDDNSTVAGATRYNANGVDINRNYKSPKTGDHPDGNAWQQETIITMAFADSMKFTMSANYHGGAELINYPWDSWTSSQKTHADDAWFQLVSHLYADTARYYSPSTYMNPSGSNFDNGITNGGDWYVVTGSRQDYLTYYTNTREVTVEISNTKTPTGSSLPTYWDYNYRSFLIYMEQCLYGLKGIITDSCTGNPIEAQVFISGHDVDNSYVYSKLPLGNYHRPLLSGTYSVSFSAPGYTTKTINNISISNFNTAVLNVALAPAAPQAIISANPLFSCSGEIVFTANIQNADTWLWHFDDGTSSNLLNPNHFYYNSGSYLPYLSVSNCVGTQNIYMDDTLTVDKPLPPLAQSASHCGQGSVLLSASYSGDVYWYDSQQSTNPLDSGLTFTTPQISQNTTYYVEGTTNYVDTVGETNPASGGIFFNSNALHYLIFDCYKPVKLLSVEVRADTARNRTIYLRNSAAQVLDSVVVFVPSGISRINLNRNIPAGNNLQLASTVYPNLYRKSGGLSYPYTIPDYISIKSSSASSNPTFYYYYFYEWEVLLEACVSERIPVLAEILDLPDADFSYLVNNLSVNFNNTSGPATSFYWDFGDGTNSTFENPTHTYANYGNYNVKFVVINSCGNDSITLPISLTTLAPDADFLGDPVTVQQGGFVQFTDLTANNPNSWLWEFEGGTPATSTLKNPLIQYYNVGTYYVSLTVNNAFGNDVIIKSPYITVYPLTLAPSADFTSDKTVIDEGDSVQFTDLSMYNPTSWLWNIEGGTPSSSTLQNPMITYNTAGTYFVSLIASNFYGSDNEMKNDFIQVNPSSINNINKEINTLIIFPNPVCNDVVNLYFPQSNSTPEKIEIFDVLGHLLISEKNIHNSIPHDFHAVNISQLTTGLYYIRCITANKTYQGKFIK